MLIDSHCHLDDRQFDADREAAIERAVAAGVETMLAIGTGGGPPDLEAGVRLADVHAQIYASVGIHPHEAVKAGESDFARLRELLSHPKVLAIGEIGLDYHYDFSPRETQRAVFVRQLQIAREAGKPIVIHTREAWDDTLEIIAREWEPHPGGIMHCFSGGPEEAERVLEMGFFVSFAGIVTFPRAVAVQEAARRVPLDRLLAETDAPYLAPVPHRGKRNEPAFLVETVRKLAALRGESFEQVAAATSDNFRRLLQLPRSNYNG
jgi:TatD DNase family protein